MRRVLVFIPLASLALFQVTSIRLFQSSGDIARLSILVITSDLGAGGSLTHSSNHWR
jgi:hypothetical protein